MKLQVKKFPRTPNGSKNHGAGASAQHDSETADPQRENEGAAEWIESEVAKTPVAYYFFVV